MKYNYKGHILICSDGKRRQRTVQAFIFIVFEIFTFKRGLRFQPVDVLEMKNASFTQKQIWISYMSLRLGTNLQTCAQVCH